LAIFSKSEKTLDTEQKYKKDRKVDVFEHHLGRNLFFGGQGCDFGRIRIGFYSEHFNIIKVII
jgi:hypothetical protein